MRVPPQHGYSDCLEYERIIEGRRMHTTADPHAVRHVGGPGAVARLAMLAALAALLNAGWRRWRDTHERRSLQRPDAKPEKLQVWEDEGGQSQMPDAPSP